MRWTIWIVANHRRECSVSAVAANKNSQESGAETVEGHRRERAGPLGPAWPRKRHHYQMLAAAKSRAGFFTPRGISGQLL